MDDGGEEGARGYGDGWGGVLGWEGSLVFTLVFSILLHVCGACRGTRVRTDERDSHELIVN